MRRPFAFPEHDRSVATHDAVSHVTRVVSIPAGHPYVATVTGADDVALLPDPRPAGAPAGQWWPPVALDPAWIRAHAHLADVLHVHFGTESFSSEHLAACLAAAREAHWPVVFTVHDIEHPQLDDQTAYQHQLDVLVPGADEVLTLTQGAADLIHARWGRTATVTPHPALLPPTVDYPVASPSAEPVVGMYLKDLRSNIDAAGMVSALGSALDVIADAGTPVRAQIRMHHRVRNEPLRDEVRELVSRSERMELIEHDRLDDAELWASLAALDVCVLPYEHGTHSGWLELCWDLAVPLTVPNVGFYAEQHTDGTVATFTPDPDGASLAAALAAVLGANGSTRAGTPERQREFESRRRERTRQAETTATLHSSLYRRLRAERQS